MRKGTFYIYDKVSERQLRVRARDDGLQLTIQPSSRIYKLGGAVEQWLIANILADEPSAHLCEIQYSDNGVGNYGTSSAVVIISPTAEAVVLQFIFLPLKVGIVDSAAAFRFDYSDAYRFRHALKHETHA